MITLGIDTSNYTTSCALYDSEANTIIQRKKLLPVKEGEKGLRQSDAVFHHTQQLYPLVSSLYEEMDILPDCIGVSARPRDVEGSYMPCFTVGVNTANSIASVIKSPIYDFSHQCGHIMAALFSADRMDLIKKQFIAFHVSGGTTEALLVKPDSKKIFDIEIIGKTLDLNCGQTIDRCGVMMGLKFPCGAELEKLAYDSTEKYNPKICVKDGNCSLSGLENQCKKMLIENTDKCDVANYCLQFVGKTIEKMTDYVVEKCGDLPVVYAGGVMSDKIIRNRLENKFNASFAAPEFSCDNAAGTAILAYLRGKNNV